MITGAEPVEVFGWQVTGQGGSDESFIGQMRFEDGIHMQFDCGFRSPPRSYIEIVGTDATLNIPTPFKPGIKNEIYIKRSDETQKINIKGEELYLGEVEDICDAILHGKTSRVTLADSRKNIAVILALLESAKSGKLVIV